MLKGELETIERYVQELESLRHYPRVKAERESLAAEAAQLKEKVNELIAGMESGVSTNQKLSSQLGKSESVVKELGRKLEQAQKELSSLRDFKSKVPEGGRLPLEKMKEKFLQAQEKEIEAKIKERMRGLERDFRSKMPALVQKELTRVLKGSNWPSEIKEVVSLTARQIADELLRDKDKWPDWFKNFYIEETRRLVGQALDSEFERRVQENAKNRLEVLKMGQWKQYSAAKAKALAVNLRTMVNELKGTRWFTCDRCGRRLAIEIGPSEIGELLGAGTVDITCSACLDLALFPVPYNVPHKVATLTLAGLLQLYLGEAPFTK